MSGAREDLNHLGQVALQGTVGAASQLVQELHASVGQVLDDSAGVWADGFWTAWEEATHGKWGHPEGVINPLTGKDVTDE